MELLNTLRIRTIVTFLLTAGLLAVAALVLYRSSQHNQEIRLSIFHARSEIIGLQELLTTVADAETGQRGYMLTGDATYLAPYHHALGKLEADLERLEALSAGDPLLRGSMLALRGHVHAKVEELREIVRLYGSRDAAGAQSLLLTGTDQREMDAIRSQLGDLLSEQNRQLDQLRQEYETSLASNNHLLAVGIGVQFVLLILVFVFFYRDLVNRAQSTRETQRAHARLDAILSTMGDGVYQVDLKGRLVYLNPAGEEILGYSRREVEGIGLHDLIHATTPSGGYRPAESCPLADVLRSGTDYVSPPDQDDWFKRSDGSFLTVEYAAAALRAGDEILGMVVSFRDITERRAHEEHLRVITEWQQAILRSANVAIVSCQADGIITTFNPTAERMLQYRADEVFGKFAPGLLHDPEEIEKRAQQLTKELGVPVAPNLEAFTVKAGRFGLVDKAEWTYIRKDGSRFPVSLTITALRDAAGLVNGFIGIAEDITDRKFAESAIRESQAALKDALEREKDEARLDFLTKIANRRAFYEVGLREITRARRYNRPLTLLYIDLDNFKQVNDAFGHETGDELLVEVAATIRCNVRATDLVARLGGDEFALLLTETNREAGLVVTNKLRETLLRAMQERNWPVTFSIGMVSFTVPPASVEEMVKQADEVMYSVKQRGKNSIAAARV